MPIIFRAYAARLTSLVVTLVVLSGFGSSQIASTPALPPTATNASTSIAKSHVRLIRNTDPTFDSIAVSRFGGLTQTSSYSDLKQISALIVNDTSTAVKAYATKWNFTLADGTQQISYRTVILAPKFTLLPSSASVLDPSSYSYITPLGEIDDLDHINPLTKVRWLTAEYSSSSFHARASEIQSVTVTLDSIVFATGKAVGPDESHLIEDYACERNGAIGEATALLPFLTNPNALEKQLLADQLLASKPRDATASLSDCHNARGRAAIRLLAMYNSSGPQTVEKVIRQVSVARPSRLGRSVTQ